MKKNRGKIDSEGYMRLESKKKKNSNKRVHAE